MPSERRRWGGKGKAWTMKLTDDHDLAEATRYALGAAHYHWQGMKHHLERVKRGEAWNEAGLTTTGQDDFNKFYHNLRAFFWELIAAFDTLLQETNRRLSLGIDPRDVDWSTLSRELSTRRELKGLRKKLTAGHDSPWFAEVREYRNFAHRGTNMVECGRQGSDPPGPGDLVFILRPIVVGGRAAGEPIGLCKNYGTKVEKYILSMLDELDTVTSHT